MVRMKPRTYELASERPETAPRIRLTISVSPEVHETYARMARAGSISIGRCMGDWLADTLDAAQHMANLMEKARAAPKAAMQEMHAYALGLADETGALLAKVRAKGAGRDAAPGAQPGAAGRPAEVPPSGNTGGKVPSGQRKGRQ